MSWTRRHFLKSAAGAGLALACSREREAPFRGWTKAAYRKSRESRVAIVKCSSYGPHLTSLVLEGVRLCDLEVRGKRVLLKPNLVEFDPAFSINTHPLLVAFAAEAFKKLGAGQVIVAEGSGHNRDTEHLLVQSGLHGFLRDTATPFVDLNLDRMQAVPLKSFYMATPRLYFPETALAADLIVSMPKLKTHHWAGVTLSLKNMFGALPGVYYGWPKNFLHWHGIDESILDINSTLPVHFCIVDGILGMEGDGPIRGAARQCGALLFGRDPVAVDATAVRIMGMDPHKVKYLRAAGEFLGNVDRIRQVGEPIPSVRTDFAPAPGFEFLVG